MFLAGAQQVVEERHVQLERFDEIRLPQEQGGALARELAAMPGVAAVLTGVTNARSEALNRLAKLEARMAYSFRNPASQRRRVRIACTRGTGARPGPSPGSQHGR